MVLSEWRRRVRSRREIATVDDCTLRDLGLSASQMQLRGTKTILARLTFC